MYVPSRANGNIQTIAEPDGFGCISAEIAENITMPPQNKLNGIMNQSRLVKSSPLAGAPDQMILSPSSTCPARSMLLIVPLQPWLIREICRPRSSEVNDAQLRALCETHPRPCRMHARSSKFLT